MKKKFISVSFLSLFLLVTSGYADGRSWPYGSFARFSDEPTIYFFSNQKLWPILHPQQLCLIGNRPYPCADCSSDEVYFSGESAMLSPTIKEEFSKIIQEKGILSSFDPNNPVGYRVGYTEQNNCYNEYGDPNKIFIFIKDDEGASWDTGYFRHVANPEAMAQIGLKESKVIQISYDLFEVYQEKTPSVFSLNDIFPSQPPIPPQPHDPTVPFIPTYVVASNLPQGATPLFFGQKAYNPLLAEIGIPNDTSHYVQISSENYGAIDFMFVLLVEQYGDIQYFTLDENWNMVEIDSLSDAQFKVLSHSGRIDRSYRTNIVPFAGLTVTLGLMVSPQSSGWNPYSLWAIDYSW